MSALVGTLAFWLAGTFLMWRIPTVRRRACKAPESWPTVSVIIPARNEQARLPRLLRSLAAQAFPPWETIVVDDESSDGTATVASSLGARVVRGEPPPSGWQGKTWACWQGARQATGELLLFLDADTWLDGEALRDLVTTHQEHGGLVAVQPYHVTERPHEQLSAFFNIVLMAAIDAFTPLGGRLQPSGAFGPCLMCTRDEYFASGGHGAVRGDVVEDVALAKVFARQGRRVHCFAGRGSISFRMYPEGVHDLVEGWSKGFAAGASAVRPLSLLLTAAWITGCFQASLAPWHAADATVHALGWWYLLAYLLYALQIGWMLRRVGRFWAATWLLYPIPLAFFTLVLLYSLLLRFVVRRARWKGRVVLWRGAPR